MATNTSMPTGPSHSPEPAQATNNTPAVSSRRLKKREIDRRCQRQARERTKSRIAYLEGLVEDFRRQDSSGHVATLMKQLREIEAERDLMARTLKDIQKAMDVHKPSKSDDDRHTTLPSERSVVLDPLDISFQDAEGEEQKPDVTSLSHDQPLATSQPSPPAIPATYVSEFELSNFDPEQLPNVQTPDVLFGPQVVRLPSDSPESTSSALVQAKSATDMDAVASIYAKNWIQPVRNCGCRHHADTQASGQKAVWRGSYWCYANDVLSERFDWGDEIPPMSEELCDDTPVRAVLEGWDAVAKRGPLHPTWQLLRRIDQRLFVSCGPSERLAILRAMHCLLRYHTESSSDLYSRLPPWYMKRPAQRIAHSYAIDYFCWPGIRERFIFNEHDYCGNEFWHLFCKSMRVLWPYEFRDCYTREVETGLYHISPNFDQRLRDIKFWAMGPEMFERFPEFYSDIPAYNSIPPTLSNKRALPMIEAPSTHSSPKLGQKGNGNRKRPVKPRPRPQPEQHQHHHLQPQNHPLQIVSQSQPPPPQQLPHLFSYPTAEFPVASALDAFAYGTINDAEFAAVYHPEDLEGYPNIVF